MPIWLAALLAKIWKYLVGVGVLIAGIGAIYWKGHHAGAKAVESKDAAIVVHDNAVANVVVSDINTKVNDLPVAPLQTVATADPDTAAGKLRDEGWTE